MHQSAVDLFQLLLQAGAVPGEDFSCDGERQAFHLNDRCHHLLQHAYPEVDWEDVLGISQGWSETAISDLHAALGCPFVDILVATMATRLPTLADNAAASYLCTLLMGVDAATGIVLYPLLMERLDMAGQARLEWLLRQVPEEPTGPEWIQDLVLAAGGTATDCPMQGDEVLLTERGWTLMTKVWQGDWALTPVPDAASSDVASSDAASTRF
ncbi:hypothetical protein [Leptolyngbya sp. PCC 6406]|uniref:hypothetical protein n=1 Tax=Leptolyngbya sp. PCC 6406 TaxID=1173264 RepID=UPI0002F5CD85|nr:hypothetical protein [Leptolyngbya sp. PCC 6406]